MDVVRRLDARDAWVASAPPGYVYRADAPRVRLGREPYAYVKIAEGCNMGCTFCAIPLMRGRHRSRALADVVAEVEALARDGVEEVVLVSQDTLAWGQDLPGGRGRSDFGDLLLALSETAIPWLRYLYLHPAHVTDGLIRKLAQARALPYIDMPIQHADDGILRAMRRGVTRRRMAEIVAALRDAIPGATLRTTVLVGFPGETDAAFETLLEFLDETRFDRVGSFVYSAEEGTPAVALPDAVPAEVAEERAGWCRRRRIGSPGSARAPCWAPSTRCWSTAPARIRPSRGRAGPPRRPRRSTGSCTFRIATSRPAAALS